MPNNSSFSKTGRSIDRLKRKIVEIFENYTQRIPTSQLNKVIEEAVIRHSLPSPNGAYLEFITLHNLAQDHQELL